MKQVWLAMALLSMATVAQAFDNGQYEGVDPAIREWFKNVKPPFADVPCCSIADGHLTSWRAGKTTQYEIPYILDGADGFVQTVWLPVADNVIVRISNPNGDAVVWYTTIPNMLPVVRCFVPSTES